MTRRTFLPAWLPGTRAWWVGCVLALSACTSDALVDEIDLGAPEGEATSAVEGAPGVLVSPELFDLAGRWSSEALSDHADSARLDLVTYARRHAPQLASEAATAVTVRSDAQGGLALLSGNCTCAVWGTFDVDVVNASGGGWYANHAGPAHDAHIYQSQTGHSGDIQVSQPVRTTRFRTRMNCQTSAGMACAAGCTAKLYADVRYASRAYAEAHTWTIWNKAGTTQVVDGAALKLRTPFGGAGETLFEKEVGASWAAKSTQFDVNQLVTLVRSGLGIYAAIEDANAKPSVLGDLAADAIRSLVGLVHRQGSDGSTDQSLSVRYSTYFDYQSPITMSYSSTDHLYYALDLTSQIRMRVRGYGYHSETGDLKSGYSIAAYMDNFVCDSSVTTPPQRAGFWRWDGYANAPLPPSTLQQQISNFFSVGIGVNVWPSANQGLVYQGVCGNNVCDTYETPSTCSSDCGYCGNGICRSQFENAWSCVQDCGYCGDGTCYGSETNESCVNDCSVCGDGTCSGGEWTGNCEVDCPTYCGDGICGSGEWGSCTWDCGCGGQFCE